MLCNLRPSLADKLRIGYFKSDQTTQTEESDIVELKHVTGTIGTLVQVLISLTLQVLTVILH